MDFADRAIPLGCNLRGMMQMESVNISELGSAPIFRATVRHDARHLRNLDGMSMRRTKHDLTEPMPPEYRRAYVNSDARLVTIPSQQEICDSNSAVFVVVSG